MADGLDVVAVGVADERAEVVRVVLRPYPWLVERLGARRRRRRRRTPARPPGRGLEREVRFPEALAGAARAEPERRAVGAVADDLAEVHDPLAAERSEHGVVEAGAGGDVGALD